MLTADLTTPYISKQIKNTTSHVLSKLTQNQTSQTTQLAFVVPPWIEHIITDIHPHIEPPPEDNPSLPDEGPNNDPDWVDLDHMA